MSLDDPTDDEDWYDDDEEPASDESVPCPECGQPVHKVAERCPACGYWLSDSDRRLMWSSGSKPLWLRVTAAIVLIAFLASVLAYGVWLF